jgi:hypothetical protein
MGSGGAKRACGGAVPPAVKASARESASSNIPPNRAISYFEITGR